ncbi:hypothetical protein [Polyangium sorediatum]|uniref:Uncharacterized protein n=1 Tax=Polyangium sorediatum TaxID=889274 RepID=A0ABT6NL46_9BACT|nr:hypothetical protein [Polyangium sorediatum]MDI1429044.1 hypothetical protein [Polyangium sorediatum]
MAVEEVVLAFAAAVEEAARGPAWNEPDEAPPVSPEFAIARGVAAALELCITPRARAVLRLTARNLRERRERGG